ncbi:hypothetical protein Hanom_Chr02g00178231 [Helianthus anomalus]
MTRTTVITQPKHAVVTGKNTISLQVFNRLRRPSPFLRLDLPPPPRNVAAHTRVKKEFTRSPSIEVVTSPSVHAEDTGKKKSPAAEKTSGSTAAGTGFEEPSIQPGESELEFYYRSYAEERSVSYHRPPWNIMQGDDISNDPSAYRDIPSGLGTPFEVLRARGLPRENRINQLSSMLVGSSIIARNRSPAG